jgi:hypothetical protein
MHGVDAGPVLEMDAAQREHLLHRRHQLVDERVELVRARPHFAEDDRQKARGIDEIRADPCNFLLVVEEAGQLVGRYLSRATPSGGLSG